MNGATLEIARYTKAVLPVILLALFWAWETWRPFFGQPQGRLLHALRNLGFALVNAVMLGILFGAATTAVAAWTLQQQWGFLHLFEAPDPARFAFALILLDAWMYFWHRANHALPLLWRFHRTHHSDRHMDVTTATRFHLGEHVGANVLRLSLIPLVGVEIWHIVVYDLLVVAITQFHHADITIGRWDRRLRWLIVTPNMHKLHHSDWQPETDSNFSTVLSVWDRLFGSFSMRSDTHTLVFGLEDLADAAWQTWWGMWKTPFVTPGIAPARAPNEDHESPEHEFADSARV